MISEEEIRTILGKLEEVFQERGIELLVLGSSAIVFRTKSKRRTKDIDLHPFPIEDYIEYWDKLEAITKDLNGNIKLESDGASATLHFDYLNKRIMVELIDSGGPHFITKEVVDDMVDTADEIDGLYIPTFEHIIVMKAEAYTDRIDSDPHKQDFFDDLVMLSNYLSENDLELDSDEINRIINLRIKRKREKMDHIIYTIYTDVLSE